MNEQTPDPGTIVRLEDATGWTALFAIPQEPYVAVLPVVKWAFSKRDNAEHREALLALPGDQELRLISQADFPGVFVTYSYLPLSTGSLLADTQGNTPFARERFYAADYGQRIARAAQTPPSTPTEED